MLNAMSAFIPDDERIVTIEDAAELQLQQEHVITLESRPPNIEGTGEVKIRELVRNALRMRPDRIIVGEVRGAETLDMLQAMNTGHEGSLTTIHANSPRDALVAPRDARADRRRRPAAPRDPRAGLERVRPARPDLRLVDGSRRITHVTEVLAHRVRRRSRCRTSSSRGRRTRSEVAERRAQRLLAPLPCTGLKPHFLEKLAANGVVLPPAFFDLEDARPPPRARRRLRVRRALAIAFLVAASLPAVAAAQTFASRTGPLGRIRDTRISASPSSRPPTKAPPSLREDGTPMAATAQNLGRGANVVPAIDRSRSMAGPRSRMPPPPRGASSRTSRRTRASRCSRSAAARWS